MTGPSSKGRDAEPSIVFHHPMPIAEVATSGSQVRPVHMISAFRSIGYRVEVVAGYGPARACAIDEVIRRVEEGHPYRFMYCESATPPTALTDPHHLPLRPAMDFRFMRRMRRSGAPVGLYYRDIHWRFPQYRKVAWHKRAVAIPFYYYDWWQYRRSVDWIFLPSQRMFEALPGSWPRERAAALPPGCVVRDDVSPSTRGGGSDLRIFYVGGVTPPLYDLTQLVEVVRTTEGVRLTLCCRPAEWREWASYYSLEGDSDDVRIVHARGEGLREHFASADVFALVWEVDDYQKFAMPVKIMEAIGFGLPIVTTEGTEVARFVAEHDIGWVVDAHGDLRDCLTRLRANRALVTRAAKQVRRMRRAETWEARARSVADFLDPAGREVCTG